MADIFSLLDQNLDFTLYQQDDGYKTLQDLLKEKVPEINEETVAVINDDEAEASNKNWF